MPGPNTIQEIAIVIIILSMQLEPAAAVAPQAPRERTPRTDGAPLFADQWLREEYVRLLRACFQPASMHVQAVG